MFDGAEAEGHDGVNGVTYHFKIGHHSAIMRPHQSFNCCLLNGYCTIAVCNGSNIPAEEYCRDRSYSIQYYTEPIVNVSICPHYLYQLQPRMIY